MHQPLGTVITAMVTPFEVNGALDVDGVAALATHLVDLGNDGLVVNGTTGEAPTTTDAEKAQAVRTVVDAVGDRARVIAGVGTNDTAHSAELARQAQAAGAHGLLAVTPYYNKPPQDGILQHFRAVADATDLPVMLYDIPGRSAAEIATDTLIALAEHPNIVAVKDAKADLAASARVLTATDLLWYSGDDVLNLPLLSLGATGFVSVSGHFIAPALVALRDAFLAGDAETARAVHFATLPVTDAIFVTQAAMTVKGVLNRRGLPAGPVRGPLVAASVAQVDGVVAALEASGA
ncbi:MAG: 4-hydroxy-tetrahydrodipicolinate synthase [Micrococcales bacterium]|nr:4-hydroxy-tetrahydrodipicolinate synthase [Micrococcales bacterium]